MILTNDWIKYKLYFIIGKFYPVFLAKILYKEELNKSLSFKNPKDLNEKINWLAFKTNTNEWSLLADKFRVRSYVKSLDLEEILIPIYGVWKETESIDLDKLPNRFVLKANHDAGSTMIVKDKSEVDWSIVHQLFKKSLKRVFGIYTAEPHYKKIKPLIFAEKLLEDDTGLSNSLIDYKFWSFYGDVKYCLVCYDRGNYRSQMSDIYSVRDWQRQDNKLIHKNKIKRKEIPKPRKLDKMIEIVTTLSKKFPQCRVDLYENNNKIYFGELTFTSSCGRIKNYTEEFLHELGAFCRI